MRPTPLAALLVTLASACGTTPTAPPSTAHPAPAELDLEAARRLLAELIASERAREGVPAVAWEIEAARAAESHVQDMAKHGFAAHVGSDGSVPELRYTRAGGVHAVMENVGCVADGRPRALEVQPRFSRAEIAAMHRAFLDAGGGAHRRNVLSPNHRAVGVGLARPAGVARACVAVVLATGAGRFAPLPRGAVVGDEVTVEGELAAPARAAFVSVARLPEHGALTASALNRTGGYATATPHLAVRPRLEAGDTRFTATVPLDAQRAPGAYAVGVWATWPGVEEPVLVSLRTIDVR